MGIGRTQLCGVGTYSSNARFSFLAWHGRGCTIYLHFLCSLTVRFGGLKPDTEGASASCWSPSGNLMDEVTHLVQNLLAKWIQQTSCMYWSNAVEVVPVSVICELVNRRISIGRSRWWLVIAQYLLEAC